MEESFYHEFSPLSSFDQYDRIHRDSQKLTPGESQKWISPEGIEIPPIFCPSEEKKTSGGPSRKWRIAQPISYNDNHAEIDRWIALAIKHEADTLFFDLSSTSVDIHWLVNRLKKEKAHAVFVRNQGFTEEETCFIDLSNTYLCADILGHYIGAPSQRESLLSKDLHLFTPSKTNSNKTLYVDASIYANAGANAVQQISFTLLHLNEYLNGVSVQGNVPINIFIKVAQGSNYFLEIAKLKAFRQLMELIIAEYSFSTSVQIFAVPQQRNKTTTDFNVNMLRSTTEMMSAILGGADTVMNHRYDKRFNLPNDFGHRIALNQLQLLKHESYFNYLPNVTQGSYYLDYLIDELKEKAWRSFLEHEQAGGWLNEVQRNNLQQKIKHAANEEQERLKIGERVLVGSTAYQDPMAPSASPLENTSERNSQYPEAVTPLTICYLH